MLYWLTDDINIYVEKMGEMGNLQWLFGRSHFRFSELLFFMYLSDKSADHKFFILEARSQKGN